MTLRNNQVNGTNGVPSSSHPTQFAAFGLDPAKNVDLEALREQVDFAAANYCRGIEHTLATKFPNVSHLEFEYRHADEPTPFLRDAFGADEQPVDDETIDQIRDELSGIADRDFGDWADGSVLDLAAARNPAYVLGGPAAVLEAQSASMHAIDVEAAKLNDVEAGCARVGWNSLADMIERLHDRGQVDIADSANLTDEQLATLGERHFAPLVDRVCETIGEDKMVEETPDEDEWVRFKERGVMELGATTTTMEAIETALDREEIWAGTLDNMNRDTMDAIEDHTERALERLAGDARAFLESQD